MNKYNLLIPALLIMVGCEDFLSTVPDNRTAIDTKEKISELLVTAYPEANYAMFCESMSDNVEDNPSGFQDERNTYPYYWQDPTATAQDSPEHYWNSCYAAIASCNHALKAIEKSGDPVFFNDQKGEALLARAYSHFMIVSLFAKVYDAQTANADMGIPYVTEPETVSVKKYERHTVSYVYDMIEKDLTEGLALVNDQAYPATGAARYHFTKAAAHAFAARFYLFKKQYEKVIEHASAVFPSGDFASYLRPWNTTYRTYSSTELAAAYTRATESANLLLCETLSEWARSYNALRFSSGTLKFQSMFLDNPTFGNYAFAAYYTSSGVYFVNKFREHFVRIGNNASTGYAYTIMPLFTAEEALLNRAEAYAMLNQNGKALDDLNTWISKRVLYYDPYVHNVSLSKLSFYYPDVSTHQQLIINALLDFKRVEFIHEGMRWFDILRHKLPVVHTTHNGETIELLPNDPRRVLQIPREAISMGGLQPNPR